MPSSTRLLPVLVLAWGAACSCDEPTPRFLDASGGSAGDGGPAEVGLLAKIERDLAPCLGARWMRGAR